MACWQIQRSQPQSHSPHPKHHFPGLLLVVALANVSYWPLQCCAQIVSIPALLCHNSCPESLGHWPSKVSHCLQQKIKLLGRHRLLILVKTLRVAKIFLCSMCQWKGTKSISWEDWSWMFPVFCMFNIHTGTFPVQSSMSNSIKTFGSFFNNFYFSAIVK